MATQHSPFVVLFWEQPLLPFLALSQCFTPSSQFRCKFQPHSCSVCAPPPPPEDHSSLNHTLKQREVMIFMFGEAWARMTPYPDNINAKWLRGTLRFLNFGQPFGIKEHVVASQIASSGNNGLSGVEVYAIERLFYDRSISASTAVLATFSIGRLCLRLFFSRIFISIGLLIGNASSNSAGLWDLRWSGRSFRPTW